METTTYRINYTYNGMNNLFIPVTLKDMQHTLEYMVNNGRVVTSIVPRAEVAPTAPVLNTDTPNTLDATTEVTP